MYESITKLLPDIANIVVAKIDNLQGNDENSVQN